VFTQKYNYCDILGTSYVFNTDPNSLQISVISEYVNNDNLKKFLERKNDVDAKIFQGFVPPQGPYNCIFVSF